MAAQNQTGATQTVKKHRPTRRGLGKKKHRACRRKSEKTPPNATQGVHGCPKTEISKQPSTKAEVVQLIDEARALLDRAATAANHTSLDSEVPTMPPTLQREIIQATPEPTQTSVGNFLRLPLLFAWIR
jgi:hypothetical protein